MSEWFMLIMSAIVFRSPISDLDLIDQNFQFEVWWEIETANHV